MISLIIILNTINFYTTPDVAPHAIGSLEIQLITQSDKQGKLYIALFDAPDNFPNEGAHFLLEEVLEKEKYFSFESLPFGKYALAIFQDLNENGKLDKNLWGIPTEPYGFSNNPKAKWKKPTYEEAAFPINQQLQKIEIQILDWKSR